MRLSTGPRRKSAGLLVEIVGSALCQDILEQRRRRDLIGWRRHVEADALWFIELCAISLKPCTQIIFCRLWHAIWPEISLLELEDDAIADRVVAPIHAKRLYLRGKGSR